MYVVASNLGAYLILATHSLDLNVPVFSSETINVHGKRLFCCHTTIRLKCFKPLKANGIPSLGTNMSKNIGHSQETMRTVIANYKKVSILDVAHT